MPGSTAQPDTCAENLISGLLFPIAPVAHIESREVIASILGVKDVLVDDKSCSSGFRSVPHSDLPDSTVFPKDVIPAREPVRANINFKQTVK